MVNPVTSRCIHARAREARQPAAAHPTAPLTRPTLTEGLTAMTDYCLIFEDLGGDRGIPPLTVTAATPPEIAQGVHRHARPRLASRTVDVVLDSDGLSGTVHVAGRQVGTFTVTEQRAPAASVEDPMHGFTLEDLNGLTAAVLRMDRWRAADATDRYEAVWHALAEHLCVSASAPTRREMITVGIRASDRHVTNEMHHLGRVYDPSGGTREMPGFTRFWGAHHAPSPERRVVEGLAVEQIMPRLTPRQRQALQALAVHGDYQTAAAAIGSEYKTFNSILKQGRRRFYACWHQGETPPKSPWRKDRRVSAPTDSAGKRRLTVSEVESLRARYTAGVRLWQVAEDAGIPVSTLSALLRGTRKPAPDPIGAS
jgi:hypothetical protein